MSIVFGLFWELACDAPECAATVTFTYEWDAPDHWRMISDARKKGWEIPVYGATKGTCLCPEHRSGQGRAGQAVDMVEVGMDAGGEK